MRILLMFLLVFCGAAFGAEEAAVEVAEKATGFMAWMAANWMVVVGVVVGLLEILLPFVSSTKANGVVHGMYEFLKGLLKEE